MRESGVISAYVGSRLIIAHLAQIGTQVYPVTSLIDLSLLPNAQLQRFVINVMSITNIPTQACLILCGTSYLGVVNCVVLLWRLMHQALQKHNVKQGVCPLIITPSCFNICTSVFSG